MDGNDVRVMFVLSPPLSRLSLSASLVDSPSFLSFFFLVLVSVCVVGVYAWMGWVCAYIYVKIKKKILKLSAVGV